jgi:hypothetical protein
MDKGVVEKWFEEYTRIVEEISILPGDIYNFDKTGFKISVSKDQ